MILSSGLSCGRHRAVCHASRTLTREESERKGEYGTSVDMGQTSLTRQRGGARWIHRGVGVGERNWGEVINRWWEMVDSHIVDRATLQWQIYTVTTIRYHGTMATTPSRAWQWLQHEVASAQLPTRPHPLCGG